MNASKRTVRSVLLFLLGVSLVLPVVAHEGPYASMDEPHGILIYSVPKNAQSIYEVHLTSIDGLRVRNKNPTLWLKPGKYVIGVEISSSVRQDGSVSFRGRPRDIHQLTLVVEAGKSYYLGGKYNHLGDQQWEPVLWKTESSDS